MSFEQILVEHTEVHNNLRMSFSASPNVHFFVAPNEYGLKVGSLKVTFDKSVSPHAKSVLVQNAGKKDTKTDFKKAIQLVKKAVDKCKADQQTIDEYDVIEKMEALDVSVPGIQPAIERPEYNKTELMRLAQKHSSLFIRRPKTKRLDVITGGAILRKENELATEMKKVTESLHNLNVSN
jgi:hypothetical protein